MTPESVAEALQKEITRVRDVIMPGYIQIGQAGSVALFMMQKELDKAVKALAEQDAIECINSLKALQEYTN